MAIDTKRDVDPTARHPHSGLKTQKELKAITDSEAYKQGDHKTRTEMLGGKTWTREEMEKKISDRDEAYHEKAKKQLHMKKGGKVKRKNTSRENRLEELGRVDAEKARTRRGKRNLKSEKKRIVRELKSTGGSVGSRGVAIKGFGKEIR